MYYDVIPGQAELFRAKFRDVMEMLQMTPGHTRSDLYQRVDDPDSYAILSEWEDRDSFLSFIQSDVFRQVTNWGRKQVLRGMPRHKIYPRSEDLGRGEDVARCPGST